jgi:hypothetical protein
VTLASLVVSSPAWAQWDRVTAVPATQLFSLWAGADTLAVGADTLVHVSTDGGTTWRHSSSPAPGVAAITALWYRNGRLYAGTFGQGVYVSDDLGATWIAFNDGLVGGALNSQLDLDDFAVRGDTLVAATAGAGVWRRPLTPGGAWQPFGDIFEPEQAANVNDLESNGARLLASAGANGEMFFRDPGDTDWSSTFLDNVGLHPGLQAYASLWTGTAFVVGTGAGTFRSTTGAGPWMRTDPGLGPPQWTTFARHDTRMFASFDFFTSAVMAESDDDGAHWAVSEIVPSVFVRAIAVVRTDLYAARGDGLWRRTIGPVSVGPGAAVRRVTLAVEGAQPVGDRVRLRLELPLAGPTTLELFDVLGRRVTDPIVESWGAGAHESALDLSALAPGVYSARLRSPGGDATARLVHVR